jgi:large subunit ribosomal protein L23
MELLSTDVIKRPLISEKSYHYGERFNAYSFEVDSRADKNQIRRAVEEIYKVKVDDVRTIVVPGKPRRTKKGEKTTSSWKKAIVKVHGDHKLEIY